MSNKSPRGIDRRLFLAGAATAAAMAPTMASSAVGDLNYYVGTYASSGGKGAQMVTYAPAYDTWKLGKADATVANASFGVYSKRLKRHYVVNEQENGAIGVYQISSSGKWTKKGEASSHGNSPCYISLDATESWLAVANYGTGNIAVYKLDSAGLPVEPAVIKQNAGTGTNPERQEGPHAHWVKFSPDQKFIYSVDLGTDEVLGYSFDAATGAVGEKFVAYKTTEQGFGPRHLVIHPSGSVAYVVGELTNAIVVLRPVGDGTFDDVQYISTLPEGFTGASFAGHIALNEAGNMLYVSNRGHNSIAVFGLDPTGRLAKMQTIATGGDWPRFFYLVPGLDRLVVAHQKSNDLTVMALYTNGTLRPNNQKIDIVSPVFMGPMA